MKVLLLVLAVLVGALVPLQGTINSRMGLVTGQPLLATLISFTGGFLAISLIVIGVSGGLPKWEPSGPTPLYLFLGGLPGVVFVLTALMLIPRIGVAAAVCGFVVGQLSSSLLFDHFGWLGAPLREVTMPRLVGVALLAAGTILVVRGEAKSPQPDAASISHDPAR
ncbi:MAG: transporter family-2 protein [Planctomycetota bacterium]|jgi:transporter family-2 protein